MIKKNKLTIIKVYLYLRTTDLPPKDLKFRRNPAWKSDKQLRVGQRVSITAEKVKDEFGDYSEYLRIIHIEPL